MSNLNKHSDVILLFHLKMRIGERPMAISDFRNWRTTDWTLTAMGEEGSFELWASDWPILEGLIIDLLAKFV